MDENKLTLEEAMQYTDDMLAQGHKSDGCTMAPDMGINRFCRMHDMLRRFKPVSALQADNLFFQGIVTKGPRYYPIAVIYWLAVRIEHLSPLSMAATFGVAFMSTFILVALYLSSS